MSTIEIRGTFVCATCHQAKEAGQMIAGRSVCLTCAPLEAGPVVRAVPGTRCRGCDAPIVSGRLSLGLPYCGRCAEYRNATGPRIVADPAPARKSDAEFEADWRAGRR